VLERYLCVGGIEIANPCRTLTYLRNLGNPCLVEPPSMAGCCEDWLDDDPFTTPAADDAPWYDPGVPESADVLGVWIEQASLSSPWSRQRTDGLSGTTLGRGRMRGRELQVDGWLYARTPAATAYGRQWLFEALAGECADSCSMPDATIYLSCGCEGADPGVRTMRRVGLIQFDPNVEPEFPRACGFKFSALITAEVGELFGDPDRVADLDLWRPEDERVCNVCVPCPQELPTAPCDCGGLLPPLRTVVTPDDASLWCEPAWQSRHVVQVPSPDWWRSGTLVVTVDGGRWPGDPGRVGLKNLRVRGWPQPPGITDPAAPACVEPCLSIEIGCVPPDGVMVIDGTTRRATLTCGGQEVPAYPWISSGGGRFLWPDVSCGGLLLSIEADGWNTSPTAHLAVDLVMVDRA